MGTSFSEYRATFPFISRDLLIGVDLTELFPMTSGTAPDLTNGDKYGEKNDLSGEIDFYNALLCRTDELRCGTVGKYFIEANENENDTMIR